MKQKTIVWLSASEKTQAVWDVAEGCEKRARKLVERVLEIRDDPVCDISDDGLRSFSRAHICPCGRDLPVPTQWMKVTMRLL